MNGWTRNLSRREADLPAGESVLRRPQPRLAAHVLGYVGSRHTDPRPVVHRVSPVAGVTVVLDFEKVDRWSFASGSRQLERPSLVDGLRVEPAVFEQSGHDHGLTIGLTPAGAYALFGMPLKELSNASVGFVDLLGARAAQLIEELAGTADWPARFTLLDDRLAGWMRTGPELDAPVQAAWDRLIGSGGRSTIRALAGELGWTRQHLQSRFHAQIGLPPKSVARIARFHRALGMLAQPHAPRWADIATSCGYADQPHFNREFRAFTGRTPSQFLTLTCQSA